MATVVPRQTVLPGVTPEKRKRGRPKGKTAVPVTRDENGRWGGARTPPDPERHPVILDVEGRVEYVASLMMVNKWKRSRTRIELSARWGVAGSTIQDYSAEANRLIDRHIKDQRSSLASSMIGVLRKIARQPPMMPGDTGAAVRAAEALLKVTGYAEPEEDKSRASTVQIIQVGPGQACTSPAMQGLVAGLLPQKRPHGSDQSETTPADAISVASSVDSLEGPTRSADSDP